MSDDQKLSPRRPVRGILEWQVDLEAEGSNNLRAVLIEDYLTALEAIVTSLMGKEVLEKLRGTCSTLWREADEIAGAENTYAVQIDSEDQLALELLAIIQRRSGYKSHQQVKYDPFPQVDKEL